MRIRIDSPGITYKSSIWVGGASRIIDCKNGIAETEDTVLAEHLLTTQVGAEMLTPEPKHEKPAEAEKQKSAFDVPVEAPMVEKPKSKKKV
jgi:hypothetical protein